MKISLDFVKSADKRRRLIMQFVEYLVGGGVWFWSGYGAFALFYSAIGWNWLAAKLLGDTVGFVCNFFVQRYWAFNDPRLSRHNLRMTARYVALMAVHVALDYAIVGGLKEIFDVSPYAGAFAAAGVLTLWNYLWFKFFVFNPEGSGRFGFWR